MLFLYKVGNLRGHAFLDFVGPDARYFILVNEQLRKYIGGFCFCFFLTMGKDDRKDPTKNNVLLSYLLIFKHAIFPVCGERSFLTPLSMKS
jgi:hypothetical protein